MLVTQSYLTLSDPVNCSLPSSSVHGILQARILEWVAIPFSRGSSQPRDRTLVSCTAGRFFIIWATREIHISAYSFIIEYGRPYCLIVRNSFPFPLLREPQHCSKSTFLQSHVLQKSVCIPNPRSELAVSFFFFKLYIIVLVLPNIKMNPPQQCLVSLSYYPCR